MKLTKPAEHMTVSELAGYIDHSVLKPQFTLQEVREQITAGIRFGCKTVCINPANLPVAQELCKGSATGICVTCDFPFGASSTESKVAQAEIILRNNTKIHTVDEIDMVSNYGLIRSGEWTAFGNDIKAVADAVHKSGASIKVILETDALTLDEIAKASDAACTAGADFVKTSTGFYTEGEVKGATTEVVKVMLDAVHGRCKVKGAGCIRTQEHFFELINMGIDRMGIGYRSTPVVLGYMQ